MSDLAIDPAAFAEVDRLLSDPVALAGKISELMTAARAEFGQRQASLDRALEKVISRAAEDSAALTDREKQLAEREHALSRRAANVEVAERELFSERQRVSLREAAVERRAADLTNRLHSAA